MNILMILIAWYLVGLSFAWWGASLEFGSFCKRWPLYRARGGVESAKLRGRILPVALLGPIGMFYVFGVAWGQSLCGNEVVFTNVIKPPSQDKDNV